VKRLLVLLVFACPLFAQRNPADYERYLLPVIIGAPVPGAFGSLWTSTFRIANDGPETLDVFPLTRDCLTSASCYYSMRPAPAFQPHQGGVHRSPYQMYPFGTTRNATGTFLYVERAKAQQLSVRLAVSDISRTPPASTQLPVVPESQFFDGTRNILGVPFDAGTRVALRVYTSDERADARVIVRVSETIAHLISTSPFVEGPALLAEGTFAYTHDEASDKCGFIDCQPGVRYLPSTIVIGNLVDVFPQLANVPTSQPYGLRIEIEPATPGLRYWPLVTVTRDADSMVSVFTAR
jgi:hypothetical protein